MTKEFPPAVYGGPGSTSGFLAKKLLGVPFVLTTHSLEPLRAWKTEQLGAGYMLS